MATLNNTRISDTYHGLIKTLDNTAISATLKQLSDGDGTATGLSINNAGDFKVNAILEFGSLKDTGENIIISKFVDAADGIGNNDNDTSIPTSGAVVSYVASVITAEDLDFTGDDAAVSGDVDLNSEKFRILGTANEIETSVVSAGGNQLKIGIPTNPVLTGIVTATTFSGDLNGTINTATTAITQTAGNNSTKVATTAYVDTLDAASDLDFKGDSGTGDVTLNSQIFNINGTANEITTTASGNDLTISLPTSISTNLVGNVTGNLTGNVTGNVAGDLTGNVTATSVLANGVSATTQASSDSSTKVATTAYVKSLDNASNLNTFDGSTAGIVNLNTQSLSILGTASQVVSTVLNQGVTLSLPNSINVNSASATILQTARDISLTGEASATISSFNGSVSVSGAVTLDNDSVTEKVLTGLSSPTATNILASDSILQAFGKTQSQLNTLAGGLRFMGTWNATTNTPTLASGGGESASGAATGTTAFKLVDSSGGFTSGLVGDKVINQSSGAFATVTNFDSNTVLTLSLDIMVSGQTYTIDNSPFLQQGHYFVVSVGGTSSLNGISNWAVGDWVIAGATNVWEKLDHTQVDGTGTVGNITKWSSTNVIADSIMAETGSGASALVTASGSLKTTGELTSVGNFEVGSSMFTVDRLTGNADVHGALQTGRQITLTSTLYPVLKGSHSGAGAGDFLFSIEALSDSTVYSQIMMIRGSSGKGVIDIRTRKSAGVTSSIVIEDEGDLKLTTGDLYLIDGKKAKFGNSQDLEIYHDGSNSYISDTGTGSLKLTSSDIIIQTTGGNAIIGEANQGVKLFYNAAQKFVTTNTGISVTGIGVFTGGISAASLTIPLIELQGDLKILNKAQSAYIPFATKDTSGSEVVMNLTNVGSATFAGNVFLPDNKYATFGGANNAWELQIGVVGDNAFIEKTATNNGDLFIKNNGSGKGIIFQNGGATALTIDSSQNSTFTGLITAESYKASNFIEVQVDDAEVYWTNTANSDYWVWKRDASANFSLAHFNGTTTDNVLIFSSTNNATFAGNVKASTLEIESTSIYQAKIKSTGAQYLLIGSTNAGSAGIILDGDSNGDGSGGDYSYLIHETSGILKIQQDSPSGTNELHFGTAGTESRMVMTSAGMVVVGGTAYAQNNAISFDSNGQIDQRFSQGTARNQHLNIITGKSNGLQFIQDSSDNITYRFHAGSGPVLLDVSSAGIGIGTASPLATLHLSDPAVVIYLEDSDGTASYNITSISNSGNNLTLDTRNSSGGFVSTDYQIVKNTSGAENHRWFTQGTEKMRISSNGRTSINVNSGATIQDSTLQLKATGASENAGIMFVNSGNTTSFNDIAGIASFVDSGDAKGNLQFWTRNSDGDNTNVATRMKITSEGKINIGSTTNFHQFEPEADMDFNFIMNAGQVNASPNYTIKASISGGAVASKLQLIGNTGNLTITGSLTQNGSISDVSLKENIKPVENALDKIEKLNAVTFDWKKSDSILQLKEDYGFIAQEVEKVIPEIVRTNDDDKKAINYNGITSVLVKAIQELKAEVELLKQQCNCK